MFAMLLYLFWGNVDLLIIKFLKCGRHTWVTKYQSQEVTQEKPHTVTQSCICQGCVGYVSAFCVLTAFQNKRDVRCDLSPVIRN